MGENVFLTICEQLGYHPDDVLNVRMNRDGVVVLRRDRTGQLVVRNYGYAGGRLRLISQGTPIGRPAGRPVPASA